MRVRALLSFGLGFALAMGCSDRSSRDDEHCFEISRWEDELQAAKRRDIETKNHAEYDRTLDLEIGICDYGPDASEWKSRFPEYDYVASHWLEWVSYCVPISDDGTCDLCEPAIRDADLLAYVDEQQTAQDCPTDERAVLEYERGCVVRELDDDGVPDRCCYSALIVTECSHLARIRD